MIFNSFQNLSLSMLGFGTMRLPLLPDGEIDREEVRRMTALAMEKGVNYFDTAYPYHGGKSELVISEILRDYPRESYFLADKYPGHQIVEHYDPEGIFEDQLRKCGVDYFDFYLLHNVYENDLDVYKDQKWGIIDYFRKQKENGRIRHLGFSSHARPETLRAFLEYCKAIGFTPEFCQIQLNYVDWTLQDAEEKVRILNEYNIPVWVMEPAKGGRLANLKEKEKAFLEEKLPGTDPVSLSFRFLMDIPGVTVVLSGMSDFAQMAGNLETFDTLSPLSEKERDALLTLAESMKNALPCTACRYCCDGCPMGLDIPMLIHAYNDMKFGGSTAPGMQIDALPEEKRPSACINCGRCEAICPQGIRIPAAMAELEALYDKSVKWADVCKEREEQAKRLKGEK